MTQKQKPARKKNTGIPYEIAVQRIFQEIVSRETGRNITVKHNEPIQGQIDSHQIDVLWRFTLGGMDFHLTTPALIAHNHTGRKNTKRVQDGAKTEAR